MLRRPLTRVVPAPTLFAAQLRFGAGPVKEYNHGASMSRPLTEDDGAILQAQKNRTVSGIVPGKLFMRHWLAGEQATVSIYNRVFSLIVTWLLVMWAGAYASNGGFKVYSMEMTFVYAMFAFFMVLHTHMNLMPCFLGAYAVLLVLGY